jgi:hypothetical protein
VIIRHHLIVRVLREIGVVRTAEAAAAMAAAVEMVAAEAVINPVNSRENSGFSSYSHFRFRFIPSCIPHQFGIA